MGEKYWEQFMNSGRIEDYLKFKMEANSREEQREESGDAGKCVFDGNSVKADAHWGVRQTYHPFDQGKG